MAVHIDASKQERAVSNRHFVFVALGSTLGLYRANSIRELRQTVNLLGSESC